MIATNLLSILSFIFSKRKNRYFWATPNEQTKCQASYRNCCRRNWDVQSHGWGQFINRENTTELTDQNSEQEEEIEESESNIELEIEAEPEVKPEPEPEPIKPVIEEKPVEKPKTPEPVVAPEPIVINGQVLLPKNPLGLENNAIKDRQMTASGSQLMCSKTDLYKYFR